MFPFVVADIGGTNARFALATAKEGAKFVFENVAILRGADYPNFCDALQTYLDSLGSIKPNSACVAIASPIGGDVVKMTNSGWTFSKLAVQAQFDFSTFSVINDYAAVAIASSRLQDDDLIEIKGGIKNPTANKAVLGAGTGLGVAGLAFNSNDASWLPIPSQGGHVNVASATEFEAQVILAGMKRFDHISAEIFMSGPGLINLYRCVCDVKGEAPKPLETKDITAGALAGEDKNALLTLETFCAFLGSLAGNLVLTYGALGGVYISGGIVPRFTDFLKYSLFAKRFSNKGVMSHYLENVPVNLVGYPQTAFLGAAVWLEQTCD